MALVSCNYCSKESAGNPNKQESKEQSKYKLSHFRLVFLLGSNVLMARHPDLRYRWCDSDAGFVVPVHRVIALFARLMP